VPAPQDKAWSDGYAAGKRGKPDSACPYKKGTAMTAWQQGWQNGAKSRDAKDG